MKADNTWIRGLILGGALVACASQAEIAGSEFSADVVMRGPDGQMSTGKLYVGTNRMRMEMTHQGRTMINILDQNRGMAWMIMPDQQAYMERPLPTPMSSGPGATQMPTLPSAETNPCQGLQHLTCRRAGEEDVGGRRAVKWEMSMTHEGRTLTGAQWLDAERGMPLKYQMPNGQAMELKLVGTDKIGGRDVEKWQMTMTMPNEQPIQTYQWYDPKLKLAVRQEMPGGFVQELTNIQIGPQPDALFEVPAGYTKVEPPPMPTPTR